MEGWSHLWLIWIFDQAIRETWSPTVLPPRLGGKTRMGVFATRSPFRPNPIGLSSVKLVGMDLHTKDGPILHVAGADLMDGTPILDVKPYLPYTDSHPDAMGGFADWTAELLNRTVMKNQPKEHHFTGTMAGLWDGVMHAVRRVTHTMSYGLLLFGLGLCVMIIYLLMY